MVKKSSMYKPIFYRPCCAVSLAADNGMKVHFQHHVRLQFSVYSDAGRVRDVSLSRLLLLLLSCCRRNCDRTPCSVCNLIHWWVR